MNQSSKTAIVTGGYGAIGAAISSGLADAGFRVVIVGRDPVRGSKLAEALGRHAGARIEFALVDLSSRDEIEAFAGRWSGPLHVLVNNAGATPRHREETPEGIEVQLATNVLGYVWMAFGFEGALAASGSGRVVNVASYWAGDLDVDDLEFRRRRYDNNTAYRQSKQANRMLTVTLAAKFGDQGITVNACHPGDTRSKLASNLGFGGSQTPQECARTPLYLAASPEVAGVTGGWFSDSARQTDRFVQDSTAVDALWNRISEY